MKYRTDLSPNERLTFYQEKLKPANFVIAMIAIVGFLTLLLGSVFSVRLTLTGEEFTLYGSLVSADFNNEQEMPETEEDRQWKFEFQDVNCEVRMSLSLSQIFRILSSKNGDELHKTIDAPVGQFRSGVLSMFRQVMPYTFAKSVILMAGGIPEGKDWMDYDANCFKTVFGRLSADSPDIDAIREELIATSRDFTLTQMQTELSTEHVREIGSTYDGIVAKGYVDGVFSMDAMVKKNAFSDVDSDGISEDPFDFKIMPSELAIVRYVACGVAGMVCAAVLSWAILFTVALSRIFTKNKKVHMWYAELFGLLPCLLFVIVPMLAVVAIPFFLPQLPGVAALSSFRFGGVTIVSGICVLLLWILSIAWYHPLKRAVARAELDVRHTSRFSRF